MKILPPDAPRESVDERVSERGYKTGSERVRELIRQDQGRAHFRDLLVEGAASRPGKIAAPAYFEGLCRKGSKRGNGRD
jgi:antitoxin ParD1/3/4